MKNVKKNVIFSGVGYVLPLLTALVTIPIMIKHLGVDLYGLYIICISLVGFMTLVDLGVGQAIIKYVSEYEVTNQRFKVQPVLNIAFLIYLVIGLVSAGSLYVFSSNLALLFYDVADKRADAEYVLQVTALALFFSYVSQFFLNACKAYHRFDIPSLVQSVSNIAGLVLSSVLVIMGYSIKAVMWGYVLVYLAAFLTGYLFILSILPEGVKLGIYFNAKIFKEIISFSFYTFVSNFVGVLTSRADKLFIGAIIGPTAVTYYQIPYTIAQMANGIIHTLVQIFFPRFSELSSLNKKDELLVLYKKVTVIMAFISMLIAVMLISVGKEFLAHWLTPELASKSALTLNIMALFFFFQSNTATAYWMIQGAGNAKLMAVISVLSAIAYFPSVYYLGKHYSYNGAASALFFTFLPLPLLYLWISRNIGHGYIKYISILSLFLSMGFVIVYLLGFVNSFIGNDFLKIITNGVFAFMLMSLFYVFFLKKTNLSGVKSA
jgi:O-antigen/teichoic acid export membrane protein